MSTRRDGDTSRGWGPWTVRTHLAVIVAVVVLVFVVVGVYLGQQTWRNAQRNVRENADYLAGVAADVFAETAAIAIEQTGVIAENPVVPSVYSDPSQCTLDFSLEPLSGAHLDLIGPDGEVVCSSSGRFGPEVAHEGLVVVPGETTSEVFTDAVTGGDAIAFAAPVEGLGHAVVVAPIDGMVDGLIETLGGPRRYQFAVVDEAHDRVLAASDPDLVATDRFLRASQPVEGTSWTVVAGADPAVALDPTRSVLLRGVALGGAVLAVLVASIVIVGRRIVRPLRQLTAGVRASGAHVHELLAGVDGPAEIEELAGEFREALAAREAFEAQLSHQSLHDPLTGLPNRALLGERLGDAIERSTVSGATVAVLFLDLDRFKLVNDSLGHDVGDRVLVEVAGRLRDLLPATATLARFGGDEFVVVVEVDDVSDAHQLADRIIEAVDDPVETEETVVRVTASVGIATAETGRRPHDLVRDADNAMYAAKESGRGRVVRFDDRLHHRASTRLMLASEFRAALDRDQLHLEYQPKIDLATGTVAGVEALLRWEHPALGSVPPGSFIPIAEETDAIVRVGEFVLQEACRQAVAWRDDGIDVSVAVNVSGRQLSDGELPIVVESVLATCGLDPSSLWLELTESLLMTDTIATQRTIEALHELGVRLSIDDFGTGYSSLAYLHRFPVDELKIDRTFVGHLTAPSHRAPLVPAVIAMARALNLTTVAEGVETPEQAARLRDLGCDYAQGFLFARPARPEAIEPILRRLPVGT